ncbi:MAG: type II 3-dehydroquinate dehydratase [Lachnospiraceae bacterium]|nr:type II 3-dehydroquinate dehydratase [Lachnospiraceae bacterium]
MQIRVINGPNINMLGKREPEIYGTAGYQELCAQIEGHAEKLGIGVTILQSNHEGDLVDMIQDALGHADAIVINPGAYTHTSIAILDAALAVGLPMVEVHISDVTKREDFRQVSYIRQACEITIMGHGINGYLEALSYLAEKYNA